MEPVSRDEFNGAMQRIDTRIEAIKESVIEMKANTKSMQDMVATLYGILYGEKQDGALFTINNLKVKVGAFLWFAIAVATPLISIGVMKIWGKL